MIAIFLGVLELMKMRRLRLVDDGEVPDAVLDIHARFEMGDGIEEENDQQDGKQVTIENMNFEQEEADTHGN